MLEFIRAQGGDEVVAQEDEAIARCEPLVELVPAAGVPSR